MVTIPSIHLNGTSAETLCNEIRVAHDALRDAYKALENITVHSRDHYVKADKSSFKNAAQEHIARLDRIGTTMRELDEIYRGIRDQV